MAVEFVKDKSDYTWAFGNGLLGFYYFDSKSGSFIAVLRPGKDRSGANYERDWTYAHSEADAKEWLIAAMS